MRLLFHSEHLPLSAIRDGLQRQDEQCVVPAWYCPAGLPCLQLVNELQGCCPTSHPQQQRSCGSCSSTINSSSNARSQQHSQVARYARWLREISLHYEQQLHSERPGLGVGVGSGDEHKRSSLDRAMLIHFKILMQLLFKIVRQLARLPAGCQGSSCRTSTGSDLRNLLATSSFLYHQCHHQQPS